MKLRPAILITLIVVLPLAALTWAVLRLAANEQIVLQQRYQDLMEERLRDINVNVTTVFADIERQLSGLAAIDDFDVEKLRSINRSEPRLLQIFVLNPQGMLTHPNPRGDLNSDERMFLIQAAKMFTGQDLKDAVDRAEQLGDDGGQADDKTAQRQSARSSSSLSGAASSNRMVVPPQRPALPSRQQKYAAREDAILESVEQVYSANPIQNLGGDEASSGWFVWYWDRGLNLIYWQRRPAGHIVGCALERARWMADLIAQLPETAATESASSRGTVTRIRLVNSSAANVYQWGSYEPPKTASPLCEVALPAPLASWRLQCFVPDAQLTTGTGRSVHLSLLTGLSAVAMALMITAWFFVKEYARDMREATQQVSFVNQVSHELKTPLTNIRMYAELLDQDLQTLADVDAQKPRERLDVILSEGQRLTRLIGNVLTFASQTRKTLQPQPRPEHPARLVQQIVERFRPALTEQHIDIQIDCRGDDTLSLDADFVEQILGNLISNVEKYAASGGVLQVNCDVAAGQLILDVKDAGPGIDPSRQSAVFEPFARACNDVNYAAGTGIGLTIARELARLHGGDLRLMDGQQGCWFQATLRDQKATST